MYEVPGMTLIPQQRTWSCWYASARMLIHWKMNQRRQSLANLIPPELDAQSVKLRDDDGGIVNAQIITMAKRLGLRAIPPMSPTPQAIEQWLRQYGPLWTNGKTHIVVIAGINGDKVKVYDPAPVGVGKVEWRSLSGWYLGKMNLPRAYTVKAGENLTKIAARYDMTWQELYNHSDNADFKRRRPNPNLIHPGDIIKVPHAEHVSSRDTSRSVQTVFLHCP